MAKIRPFATEGAKISVYVPFFKKLPTPDPEPSHICHQCGGASICKHGRRYNQCKECGGVSICEHGRQHSKCKECKACAVRAMDEGGLFDFLDVLSDFDVEIDV